MRGTVAQDPQDAVEYLAMIPPRSTSPVLAGQEIAHLFPLLVREVFTVDGNPVRVAHTMTPQTVVGISCVMAG